MQTGTVRVLLASCVTALLVAGVCLRVPATAQGPADALTGEVRSTAEGRMEGVVVIAQRQGSTVLTSVVTNELGQYQFPRNRMAAGRHTISVRAVGDVLPGTGTASVEVAVQASTGSRAWQPRVRLTARTEGAAAPVYHDGTIYQGVAGFENGRGHVDALDAGTGARKWRTFVVGAARDDPNAGGDAWTSPAIDPSLGLLYATTGNDYVTGSDNFGPGNHE